MTEFNQKIKTLLKLKSQLELYEMTIQRNLERLEKDIELLTPDNITNFEQITGNKIDDLVRVTAETVETIFLKTRHMLRQFPLDTVAQERLETLGVNFDIDIGTVVQLEKTEKEIN